MTTAQTVEAPRLLDPLSIGALRLPNRVIMSPLIRCRASEGRVPNLLMAEYYRQRASAGLILSEATAVTPMGVGYPNTPGIWSDEETEGWPRALLSTTLIPKHFTRPSPTSVIPTIPR